MESTIAGAITLVLVPFSLYGTTLIAIAISQIDFLKKLESRSNRRKIENKL